MASDVASPDPKSKLHSLVRSRGPFLGADLPPAERRAQVLSRMPLAAPARSAGSSWTRPSTALSFPGWATTASPKSATLWVSYRCRPIGQQSIVLRRPLEFTQYACGDYIGRLRQAEIVPSMSRAGCPWDNAMA